MEKTDNWIVTHGISYVVNVLVPEGANRLKAKPRCKPVLIVAPTGSGKTHIKDLIVEASGLSADREERLNCSAFPETLIESSLYGHTKGAFTGADHVVSGIIKDKAENVIVLDEIGTLPHHVQAKLLTFLDNGEFRKLGDDKTYLSNQKIIGITNSINYPKSLRDDFRHRFFVVPVPGLVDRRHDVPILLHKLVPKAKWTYLDMLRLVAYNWPGNLRELRRFAELVEENVSQINESGIGVLEWFQQQFNDFQLGRSVSSPNVPTLGDYSGFFTDRLWDLRPDLAARIDMTVPLFPMGQTLISKRITAPKFEDEGAPVNWLKNWQTWCYIFSEDPFSPEDVWQRRILSRKPFFSNEYDEDRTLRKGGTAIDHLQEDISRSEVGKFDKPPHRQPLEVRITDGLPNIHESTRSNPLKLVLEEYSPEAFKKEWMEHNKSRKPAAIAKKYRLNEWTIRSMFRRYNEEQSQQTSISLDADPPPPQNEHKD